MEGSLPRTVDEMQSEKACRAPTSESGWTTEVLCCGERIIRNDKRKVAQPSRIQRQRGGRRCQTSTVCYPASCLFQPNQHRSRKRLDLDNRETEMGSALMLRPTTRLVSEWTLEVMASYLVLHTSLEVRGQLATFIPHVVAEWLERPWVCYTDLKSTGS